MNYIAFDSHKRYTQASVVNETGQILCEQRLEHDYGVIRQFLSRWEKGSPVAVETIGNWYWIVDEIESAGMSPKLVNAGKAKAMLSSANKTDKLDARGLNKLQRVGTLPEVWIAPADLRDKRDLPRARMAIKQEKTRIKNRIHANLAKYHLELTGVSDVFGAKPRVLLLSRIAKLPAHTRYTTECLLEQLAVCENQMDRIEKRMRETFRESPELKHLMSIPGVGFVLGMVILLEIGDISRFGGPEQLASYSGCTPRVHSSGGKTRFGQLRVDINHYLKWAYTEAANVICINRHRWPPQKHVCRIYARIAGRKNHQKAIGAVARHLAEATFWMLTKGEDYLERTVSIGNINRGISAE